jgi:hypothetical protein
MTIDFTGRVCPRCKSTDIARDKSRNHSKLSFDLRISKDGIRKVVTECRAPEHQCTECGTVFKPKAYRQRQRIGHNLLAWGIHQHVSNKTTFANLATTVKECFGLDFGEWEFQRLKSMAAEYYKGTYSKMLRNIVTGILLHADETKVKLRGHITGYVWVFTNMQTVVYIYRETRKGDFLHDLLKGFDGVLVSDFYTAYDSIDCAQQKCLLHLMRDINGDLLKNPFDADLKKIANSFGGLMADILKTVDDHGLKANRLSKYKPGVEEWFDSMDKMSSMSPMAEQYRKRLFKYRSKLFTFLDYDGVPWNNNNAEHAIRPFAKYRRLVHGRITQPGVTDYLTLLSIFQTCNYRKISFFEFLRSGERDIDVYCGLKS